MNYDHDAIRKAYPNVTLIDDSVGIFDASGNAVSVAQTAVDAARTELDKLKYLSLIHISEPTRLLSIS